MPLDPLFDDVGGVAFDHTIERSAAEGKFLKQKTFGIGCFSFENANADHQTFENPSGTYMIQDWVADVESCLRQIPDIDQIEVVVPYGVRGSFGDSLLSSLGLADLGTNGQARYFGDFMPYPADGEISFRVTIPKPVQDSISHRVFHLSGTVFEVDIVFDGGFPVAFVSTPEPEESPSLCVMIVREFLRDQFAQRSDRMGGMRFSYIGPSPMWLDACIVERDGVPEDGFEVGHRPQKGYDGLDFFTSSESMSEAYKSLRYMLADEAAVFYEWVSFHNRSNTLRAFLDVRMGKLISLYRSDGLRAWFRRNFRSGRDVLQIRLDVAVVAQDIKLSRRAVVEAKNDLHEGQGPRALGPFIDREIHQSESADDFVVTAEMAAVLEASHSRREELATVALSAVGGGAVGAALTAWLSSAG